jgi:ribonuclease I
MEDTDDLSTHGLWPAYNGPDKSGRTYPAYCKDDTTKVKSRFTHEWTKHGTCTTLSQSSYQLEEEKLTETDSLVKLSDLLNSFSGETVSLSDIHDGNYVSLPYY